MKKNKIWLFIIIAILIGVGGGILVKWQLNNRIFINEEAPGQSPNVLNENGWPVHLIDGTIEKIYSVDPLKIDVKVRVYRFLPDQSQTEITKTIIAKEDATFVFHEGETNTEHSIEASSFSVDDDVAIWIEDNNNNIFKIDYFIANKIIKNQ